MEKSEAEELAILLNRAFDLGVEKCAARTVHILARMAGCATPTFEPH